MVGLGVPMPHNSIYNWARGPPCMTKSTCHQGFLSTKTHCSNLGFRTMVFGYFPYMYVYIYYTDIKYANLFWYILLYLYTYTYLFYMLQYIVYLSNFPNRSMLLPTSPTSCESQIFTPNYRPLMHRREWQNHQATGFSELFPGIDLRLLTLSQNFRRVNRRFSRIQQNWRLLGVAYGSGREVEGAIWGDTPGKLTLKT